MSNTNIDTKNICIILYKFVNEIFNNIFNIEMNKNI